MPFLPMIHRSILKSRPTLQAIAALGLCAMGASAFPPAPYYTLYGMVRDQVGQTLNVEGAVLVLLKGGEEIGRTPITNLQLDQNYELNIRIDANRPGTTKYSEAAIAAEGPFSLVVEMNGSLFYPIEVQGDLTAGKGGERVRLDLNLGEDLDGDGLPDIWEQWQLYQAGYFQDENGWPIHLIDRDGDLDGDGLSNYQEYLAGTFAGDAEETFDLEIKAKTDTHSELEFYAITGKTYTIERSTDAKTWSRATFAPDTVSSGENSMTAASVGIRPAYVIPQAGVNEFYRLTVR